MGLGARLTAVILNTLLVYAALPAAAGHDLSPPVRVTVGTHVAHVPPGTTVAEALELFGMRPRPGNLVSVTGRVLRRGAVAGGLTLDGALVAPGSRVGPGVHLAVSDARNSREPLRADVGPLVVRWSPLGRLPASYGLPARRWIGAFSGEILREEVLVRPPAAAPPAVALTFDDGPDPRWTPQTLAILKRYNVKATFFVVGRNAAAYPWIIRALRDAGMSVQNHTWSHDRLTRWGGAGVRARISPLQNFLATLDIRPRWVRPPYGSYDARTLRAVASIGLYTAMWSLDTFDWRRPAPRRIISRALAARAGEVILFHDGGGNRINTVRALPTIIEELQRRGFRFVSLT